MALLQSKRLLWVFQQDAIQWIDDFDSEHQIRVDASCPEIIQYSFGGSDPSGAAGTKLHNEAREGWRYDA